MRLRLPTIRETPHLPGRVRDAIRRQQDSSEVVVGWIQLAIVVTFSVLYALSPKPYTAEPVFAPEPWVLGAYLLFTLARVVLAHRRELPSWLLYVSVVVDMVLLLALIWSIHVKYGQPASFYLKVPTPALCLHLHRAAGTALRGPVRPDRRGGGGGRLAADGALRGPHGVGRCDDHPRLRGVHDLEQHPARGGVRQGSSRC